MDTLPTGSSSSSSRLGEGRRSSEGYLRCEFMIHYTCTLQHAKKQLQIVKVHTIKSLPWSVLSFYYYFELP